MKLVVGLTGSNAAGKGEVAAWLEHRGFRVHSLSDIVREAAEARGLPPEREYLIRVGNELRRSEGAGALAERILDRLGERDVVDSIRNPAEVAALRRLSHFVLVGVAALLPLRFARSLARSRPGDPTSLEEFQRREEEENTRDPEAQRLEATFRLADHVLNNDGELAALHRSVDRLLADLERGSSEPGSLD